MAAAKLDPDPWQARVLHSTADRMLLFCARQAGKSTVSSALAVHPALTRPNAPVLLLSPSLRQSGERARPGDDLVLAAALAAWWGNRHPLRPMTFASGGNEELHAMLDRVFPARAAWRPGPW